MNIVFQLILFNSIPDELLRLKVRLIIMSYAVLASVGQIG